MLLLRGRPFGIHQLVVVGVVVPRRRARGRGAGEFDWLPMLRIEESFGGWRAQGRDRGRVQDGRDVELDEVLVDDLSWKSGKVDLWVYAWLQPRLGGVDTVKRTREGGIVANCWVLCVVREIRD